ncbi:uncharacterized protein BO97DRAFT_413543 [Aspergillus homomorphus CBS 101889]|uniref:Uncharacterized protein n=1 Tax=Aspergillus homomorphus (strain CBS 101889) TaxID=1450537 RepID=A0A395HZU6_ASPHC|nr:hypothetical protein BO97DRAFT_413543 [Aspergillus homomorphus CBS 101889]RAL13076.1 hypothetical protein BO97DRAFT_413543 [Aspergillus homomorphus CBS 101889]
MKRRQYFGFNNPLYALAPRFDFGPEGLIMGNLVKDPKAPHLALTTVTPAELDKKYPPIRAIARRRLQTCDSPQLRIELERSLARFSSQWSCGHHKEEIQSRIQDPAVQDVLRQQEFCGFGLRRLYMVVGMQIATQYSVSSHFGRGEDGQIGQDHSFLFEQSEPRILSYRLVEIQINQAGDIDLSDYSPDSSCSCAAIYLGDELLKIMLERAMKSAGSLKLNEHEQNPPNMQ